MKDSIKIRSAKPADMAECARIMASSEPWITLQRDYAQCLESLRGGGKEMYLAVSGKRIDGLIVLQMTGTFKGYIQTVAVRAESRGKGIGTRLVRFAENRIFQESPNAFICVSSFNSAAQRLYERLGFKFVGELKDFIVSGHSECLLRKTIGPLSKFKPKISTSRAGAAAKEQ